MVAMTLGCAVFGIVMGQITAVLHGLHMGQACLNNPPCTTAGSLIARHLIEHIPSVHLNVLKPGLFSGLFVVVGVSNSLNKPHTVYMPWANIDVHMRQARYEEKIRELEQYVPVSC